MSTSDKLFNFSIFSKVSRLRTHAHIFEIEKFEGIKREVKVSNFVVQQEKRNKVNLERYVKFVFEKDSGTVFLSLVLFYCLLYFV